MNDMTCSAGVDRLMDYLERALPDEARADVDGHVAGCPRCRAFIASYVETPRILRDATDVVLPPELQTRLHAFLRARRLGANPPVTPDRDST